jgi:putative glutamine amidotransferase
MDRKRPVIGISAYDVPVDFGQWKDMRCVLVPEGYVRSVVAAGGVPVLIPPTEVSPAILDDIDAMVFTGGSDINPAVYGQEPHPASSGFYDHRDAAELELMRAALGGAMPVLGICRGMQLLNVARGGDLIQHLEGSTHKGPPGMYTRHSVTVLAGTHLAGVLGTDAHTHSCHHQAPGRLGEGLRVAATAEDGTVEAIEDAAADYVVGVLWHPEEDEEGGAALFRVLVDQATTYRRVAA